MGWASLWWAIGSAELGHELGLACLCIGLGWSGSLAGAIGWSGFGCSRWVIGWAGVGQGLSWSVLKTVQQAGL
jgi:hypothetical protein